MQEIIQIIRNNIKNNTNIKCELVSTETYKIGDIIQFNNDIHYDLKYIMTSTSSGKHYFCTIKNGKPTGELFAVEPIIPLGHRSGTVFKFDLNLLRLNPHKVIGKLTIKGE